MAEELGSQNLIRLEIENFMKIRAVEIKTDGTPVMTISGENEQGKSAILTAIEFALFGKKILPDKPIREGESEAIVEAEFDDFIICRKITRKGFKLDIQPKSNSDIRSTEEFLKKLVGTESLDPLEFMKMKPKDQADKLMRLMGLEDDLARLDEKRQKLYDQRTTNNREIKRLEGAIKSIPAIPDDTPDKEVEVSDLMEELKVADETNRANDSKRILHNSSNRVSNAKSEVSRIEDEIALMQKRLIEANEELKAAEKAHIENQKIIDGLQDIPIEPIQAKLSNLQEINRHVKNKKDISDLKEELAEFEEESRELTRFIEKVDKEKLSLIASSNFPVEGIGLSDGVVTYKGLPLSQASQAETLRVSTAIAIQNQPKIKIITMRNGSLLDDKSKTMVYEMVKEAGYLLILEVVDSSGKIGVVIEDGMVKSTNA